MPYIYVLRCVGGKFYVGQSKYKLKRGILRYFIEYDLLWLGIHKPIAVDQEFPYGRINDIVLHYMKVYGIENVRGGSFSNVVLDDEKIQEITNKLYSSCDVAIMDRHTPDELGVDQYGSFMIQIFGST